MPFISSGYGTFLGSLATVIYALITFETSASKQATGLSFVPNGSGYAGCILLVFKEPYWLPTNLFPGTIQGLVLSYKKSITRFCPSTTVII